VLKPTTDAQSLIDELVEKGRALPSDQRFILGLVGDPGAGKSTTARLLVEGVNSKIKDVAIVVPMDGYHRYNAELRQLNLFELKGVPDSFDAEAFVAMLQSLRHQCVPNKPGHTAPIGVPAFDRAIEEPEQNAIQVKVEHKIIVVEGNYLLLDRPPWNKIPPLLDECWFIESERGVIEERLLARHIRGGRDAAAARAKMESTDLPNADLIEATKCRAQRVIALAQASHLSGESC